MGFEKEVAQKSSENAEKRAKIILIVIVTALIFATLFGAIYIFTMNSSKNKPFAGGDKSGIPANITETGGFVVNGAGDVINKEEIKKDVPTIYAFFDFQCPYCKLMEENFTPVLLKAAGEGKINLVINPLSFLDQASADQFSSRAASASYTVAEGAPDKYMAFVNALFSVQPEEGGAGKPVSDEEMVKLAENVGVPASVAETIKQNRYQGWVLENTKDAVMNKNYFDNPQEFGTPTYLFQQGNNKPVRIELSQEDLGNIDNIIQKYSK